MVKCSKCGNEAEGTTEHGGGGWWWWWSWWGGGGGGGGGGGEDLKAHKHLPAHSQPEHTEYTAYHDQLMREIEKRLDKLEGK
jgi:hypothetical protein